MSASLSAEADSILSQALASSLASSLGRNVEIARLDRKGLDYASSFSIEEIAVRLKDGESLRVIFKNLGPDARLPSSVDAKPQFLYSPKREITVYDCLLRGCPDVPRCFGYSVDEGARRYWLFLEYAIGEPLWQIGDLDVWRLAVRRMAAIHETHANKAIPGDHAAALLRYDHDFFMQWPRRALEFSTRMPVEDRNFLGKLCENYDRVIEPLLAQPRTLLHGECYPSNILADTSAGRVCFLDWEMAGYGPGLVDLAALTAGKWLPAQKKDLSLAYYHYFEGNGSMPPQPEFFRLLDHARLHIAVQWLGWSNHWTPPADHQHGWLAEAHQLAEALQILS